jgi:hypothetical protein
VSHDVTADGPRPAADAWPQAGHRRLQARNHHAATMAGASDRSPGRVVRDCHLHLSALRPRRAFIPRGCSPDRAGRAHRPGLRGRWASRGVLARSHPATDPRRNARDTAGVTDALWPAQPRRSTRRDAQEWRAIETVLTPPGDGATLWPSWSPVVRSAGPAAARLANMGILDDPLRSGQPCLRTKADPAIGAKLY